MSASWATKNTPRRCSTRLRFETSKPEFAGEMRIIVRTADMDGATEVTYRCEDIPPGVRLEDNIAGCRDSLGKLAALLESRPAEDGLSAGGA